MKTIILTPNIIPLNDINEASKIGIIHKNKKYIVVKNRKECFTINRYLVAVFNSTHSRQYSSKKELVQDLSSKYPITAFTFNNAEEALKWLTE